MSCLQRSLLRVALSKGRWPLSHLQQSRCMGGGMGVGGDGLPIKVDIGKREVVGFGMNGEETYIDDVHFPFPAIRFKEDTAEIAQLREKEKGDWKKLTVEEKKALYRAAFCQTLAEMEAPSGDWKHSLATVLIGISLAVWAFMWMKFFVYQPLPDTITDENKVRAQVKRMIDMRVNPIEGFTSNYDYEKGEWKK